MGVRGASCRDQNGSPDVGRSGPRIRGAAHAGQTRLVRPGVPRVPDLSTPSELRSSARMGRAGGPSRPLRDVLLPAALLHDTVEDCVVPIDELEQRFGSAVATLVLALTKPELKKRESSEARMHRFRNRSSPVGRRRSF